MSSKRAWNFNIFPTNLVVDFIRSIFASLNKISTKTRISVFLRYRLKKHEITKRNITNLKYVMVRSGKRKRACAPYTKRNLTASTMRLKSQAATTAPKNHESKAR